MSQDSDTDISISKKQILGGLGTIGAASALGGAGSSALLSDQESFSNNRLVAGELDLKVAATHHYVDWLPETTGPDAAPGPQETDNAEMAGSTTDADLVLRPAAGQDGARAIRLDVDSADDFVTGSRVTDANGGVPIGTYDGSMCSDGTPGDDDGQMVVNLDDVKPGDFGFVRFSFAVCDNPGFVWLTADRLDSAENGVTEPEADDPNEEESGPRPASEDSDDDVVELLDAVQVAVLDDDVADALARTAPDGESSGTDPTLTVSPGRSLRGLTNAMAPLAGDIPAPEGGGAEGARNCFSAESNHRATLVWWLPVDHGNETQTDSATIDLGVYAEQCRHNDGTGFGRENEAVTMINDIQAGIEGGNYRAAKETTRSLSLTYENRRIERSRLVRRAVVARDRLEPSITDKRTLNEFASVGTFIQLIRGTYLTLTSSLLSDPLEADSEELRSASEKLVMQERRLERLAPRVRSILSDLTLPPVLALPAVSIPKSPLPKGETFDVEVTTGNVGDAAATGVTLGVASKAGYSLSPTSVELGNFAPSEEQTVALQLTTAEPGSQTIELDLTAGDADSTSRTVTFDVVDKAEMTSTVFDGLDDLRKKIEALDLADGTSSALVADVTDARSIVQAASQAVENGDADTANQRIREASAALGAFLNTLNDAEIPDADADTLSEAASTLIDRLAIARDADI